jgi:hypothetical protein
MVSSHYGPTPTGVSGNDDVRWVPDDEDLASAAFNTIVHHRYDAPVAPSSNTTALDLQVCWNGSYSVS